MKDIENIKVAAIADKNSATGFLLAGVQKVHEIDENDIPEKFETYLRDIISDPSVGFVITTEPIVETFGLEKFEKLRRTLPKHVIISVIPDRAGSRSKIGEAHIMELVRRAIGKKRSQ